MTWKFLVGIVLLTIRLLECTEEMDRLDEEQNEEMMETSLLPFYINMTTPTSTVPTTTKDICHCDFEIYQPEDEQGVLKSPNFPSRHCDSGKCTYKILPHPDKSVRLSVHLASLSTGTALKFWHIFDMNGTEYQLYHSGYEEHSNYYQSTMFDGYHIMTTAKNVGIKVTFAPKRNPHNYKGFQMSFDRWNNLTDSFYCDPINVIVGENETNVTSMRQFSVAAGCPFVLTPSHEAPENEMGEMLIDVKTQDDTYVAVRSYDRTGLFLRDHYSDNNDVRLVDASKVEVLFRRRATSRGNYKMPLITAKLLKQNCACPKKNINLTEENNKIVLRSPGYPNLYCPGKSCQTVINSLPVYKKSEKDTHRSVIMITVNCSLASNDVFRLRSITSDRYIFSPGTSELLSTKFIRPMIVFQQDLELFYISDAKKQLRFFEMNITKVDIPFECVCAMFDEEKNSPEEGGSLLAKIPKSCNIMHCHWKFSSFSYYQKFIQFEFFMEQPSAGDKVYLLSEQISEEYGRHLLSHKNIVTSSSFPIEFSFSRFNFTSETDAVLHLTWKYVKNCDCGNAIMDVEPESSVVHTSPHFPENYCLNLVCKNVFQAPPGYFLEAKFDYIDIEPFHDYLNVFEGNTSEDKFLITRIAGLQKNVTLTTSNSSILFQFVSDESVVRKGYHVQVFAYPMPIVDGPGFQNWMAVIAVTILVSIVVGGLVVAFKKYTRPNRQGEFQSLTNPSISYAASETGSTVSITFRGSNQEDQPETQTI